MLKKLATNDTAIKNIFDHYKNLAVVALVFAASIKAFSEPFRGGFVGVMSQVSGWALLILSVFLFLLCERNAYYKLRESDYPLWIQLPVLGIHSVCLFSFTRIVFELNV